MPPKKPRLTSNHCSGARARKDRNALHVAKYRVAKAAALREEVGDIQEDVIPYEHKGGEVGETIRLRRMNPSSVSGDAAHPAPQDSLPAATGNQRQGQQPGSILHQCQNLLAHEPMKQVVREVLKSPSAKTTPHITFVPVLGTSGMRGRRRCVTTKCCSSKNEFHVS